MKKHHLIGALIGGALGYYYASQPNDGTSNSPPLASIAGTVLGTIPQAVGLTGNATLAAWVAEGALLGYLVSGQLPRL